MGTNLIKEIKKWPSFKQNIAKWAFTLVFALIGLQIVSLLFGSQFPALASIKIGPSIVIVLMGALVILPFAILSRMIDGRNLNEKDIITIVLLTALVLILMFKIRTLVPEIFMQAIRQMQSVFGIGFA